MEYGICVAASKAAEVVPTGAAFVEEHIQNFLLPEKSDAEFEANLKLAKSSPLPIRAANCFFPGSIKVTGPNVDEPRILKYAETVFRRSQQVGIESLVFGSGAARQLPEGLSKSDAAGPFAALLKKMGPIAQKYNVTVVVEPLNYGECNFINTVAEGAEITKAANHPNIRLLADIFHMLRNGEPATTLLDHGKLLAHTHIAEKEKRTAPGVMGDDFRPYLQALKKVGYNGRMAIECLFTDMVKESKRAFEVMNEQSR